MSTIRQYLARLKRGVFHRGETFALEGGISFGPGRDPKGSFYSRPKLAIYWYQPDSVVVDEDTTQPKGLLKGLILRIGGLKLSA